MCNKNVYLIDIPCTLKYAFLNITYNYLQRLLSIKNVIYQFDDSFDRSWNYGYNKVDDYFLLLDDLWL